MLYLDTSLIVAKAPYTSPSGVEKEMRRALPVQAGLTVLAGLLWVGGAFFR